MSETWKDIPGYEGIYQVSDLGRVRSVDRVVRLRDTTRKVSGRVIRTHADRGGYMRVQLRRGGKRKFIGVHNAVLLAFVGTPVKGEEACHGELGVGDNTLSNLRYGSHSSNVLDKYRDGTMNCLKVARGDGAAFESLKSAASSVGVTPETVRWATKKRTRKAGGHTWRCL